jgi:teichoic acid transport system permease protein
MPDYRSQGLIGSIVGNRRLLGELVIRELRTRTAGTVGSFAWLFLQPLILIFTYWFVFSVGLKVQTVSGVPFILYFVSALAPWLMFSEGVNAAVRSISDNPTFVKKLVFPLEILPVVQVATAGVSHFAVLAVVAIVLAVQGSMVGWVVLQLPYYFLAGAVFTLSVGLVVAALNVFLRDTQQIVTAVIGVWFWLTPIVWPITAVPKALQWILQGNPLYYVTMGYRDSLLTRVPLWQRTDEHLVFWGITLVFLALAGFVFRRMRPHFAEGL